MRPGGESLGQGFDRRLVLVTHSRTVCCTDSRPRPEAVQGAWVPLGPLCPRESGVLLPGARGQGVAVHLSPASPTSPGVSGAVVAASVPDATGRRGLGSAA